MCAVQLYIAPIMTCTYDKSKNVVHKIIIASIIIILILL